MKFTALVLFALLPWPSFANSCLEAGRSSAEIALNAPLESSLTLTQAVESVGRASSRKPVDFVMVEGVQIPRHHGGSKWRAVVVKRETDQITQNGYLSGRDRRVDVPSWQQSKFVDAKGWVKYSFADGRVVTVSAVEARALEFSYLDAHNPYSPKDSIVVGIHESPAAAVNMARNAQSHLLKAEDYYIRLDEISPEGLTLTSAHGLYQRFDLHNPRYDPRGEWISDGSVPSTNILRTYKFGQVKSRGTVSNMFPGLRPGDVVAYVSESGAKYLGVVGHSHTIDGRVFVTYVDRWGVQKTELAASKSIFRMGEAREILAQSRVEKIRVTELYSDARFDIETVLRHLKENQNLRKMLESDSGATERISIAEHHRRVNEMFLRYGPESILGGQMRTPGGMRADKFLTILIAIHDIGKSLSAAISGTTGQSRHNVKISREILESMGLRQKDVELALNILSGNPFGRVFNTRIAADPLQKLEPNQLLSMFERRARDLEIPFEVLFDIHLTFYLADAVSYRTVRETHFRQQGRRLVPRDPRWDGFIAKANAVARN